MPRLTSSAVLLASLSSAFLLPACTWTSDGGLGARYVSPPTTKESAPASWSGEPIDVADAHGSIVIVGVPGKTNLTVRAKIVAGARSQTEADAAFADVADGIQIAKTDGRWRVTCGQALARHGSVDPESTGCTELRVEVPAGAVSAPLELSARAAYGGVHVSSVTVKKLEATAVFGLVADVTPVDDAEVTMRGDEGLVSGFCSTILRVPASVAARSLALTANHTDLRMSGVDPEDRRWWPGVEIEHPGAKVALAPRTPRWSGEVEGRGARMAKVVLHAQIGKAVFGTAPVPSPGELGQCQDVDPVRVDLGAVTP